MPMFSTRTLAKGYECESAREHDVAIILTMVSYDHMFGKYTFCMSFPLIEVLYAFKYYYTFIFCMCGHKVHEALPCFFAHKYHCSVGQVPLFSWYFRAHNVPGVWLTTSVLLRCHCFFCADIRCKVRGLCVPFKSRWEGAKNGFRSQMQVQRAALMLLPSGIPKFEI